MDQPEVLSPRRPINTLARHSQEDVFEGDLDADDDHGEDFLPSSLSDLLTPRERARRLSRHDSNEVVSGSPGRAAFLWDGGERLAQSAGPTMGPGFLQGLWSAEGADARKTGPVHAIGDDVYAAGAVGQNNARQTLIAQRSPTSPQGPNPGADANAPPFSIRAPGDPHSPGTRALHEHAPGQSLPGGLASALSRLHLHGPRTSSGLAHTTTETAEEDDDLSTSDGKRDTHEEEGLFAMDG
jgi:cleavage and polyadenylation specificity factor subunit 4